VDKVPTLLSHNQICISENSQVLGHSALGNILQQDKFDEAEELLVAINSNE
jgi:hypothetical protein